jgi:hypothetical protein
MITGARKARLWIGVLCAIVFVLLPQAGDAAEEGEECVTEPTDMAMQYGDYIQCAIDPIGDADVFRFSGHVGDALIVQATRMGGGTPCIELFDPDGIFIGSQQCSSLGARLDATLTKAGEHTIRISELFNDQTVPYAVVLERVAPASPAAIPLYRALWPRWPTHGERAAGV